MTNKESLPTQDDSTSALLSTFKLTDWGLTIVTESERSTLYRDDQEVSTDKTVIGVIWCLANSPAGKLSFPEVREALQGMSDNRVDVEYTRNAISLTARLFDTTGLSDYFSDITDMEAGTRIISLAGVLEPDSAHQAID